MFSKAKTTSFIANYSVIIKLAEYPRKSPIFYMLHKITAKTPRE